MSIDFACIRPAILAPLAAALSLLVLDAPAAPCDVLLNELLAGPARDWNADGVTSSRDDEWIELYNRGPGSVDLGGYLISDADSTLRIALTGTLGAGERKLVFGFDAVEWQRTSGRSLTGLSLNNSGDTVRLWLVTGSDTTQVDVYTFKSHEAASDRATGRQPDGGTWALFDGLNPYTGSLEPGGNDCMPTPGAANVCGSTPVTPATWGRVKGVYR